MEGNMELYILALAFISGWTGDDWCPTPPRPPWPWPWPWRKLIAGIGGVLTVVAIPLAGGGDVDIIGTIAAGLVGGAFLGGLANYALARGGPRAG
jgi:hypothetical protein